jgi:ribulose-bisphosphate carboxylase large chain
LIGGSGEPAHFHLRYFEVAPGGHTSLEHHGHIHAVVALRGCGSVRLGEEVFPLSFGDVVYVAPGEVHQLRNDEGNEPFGFLCVVNAERDAPTLV